MPVGDATLVADLSDQEQTIVHHGAQLAFGLRDPRLGGLVALVRRLLFERERLRDQRTDAVGRCALVRVEGDGHLDIQEPTERSASLEFLVSADREVDQKRLHSYLQRIVR